MTLSCRRADAQQAVVIPTSPAMGSWLVGVRYEAGAFFVRYLRDEAGWLVGSPAPDDGIYDVSGDGTAFGDATLVQKGSLVP